MKVLITGGAGYIGSTIASCLMDRGHTPVILDSLVKGRKEFVAGRTFYQGDVADRALLEKIAHDHPDIGRVIHCAALIVVPESVERPYLYYRENVSKSVELFYALHELGIRKAIFSSSASIYGPREQFQVDENCELEAHCPYAYTKIAVERVLSDFSRAYGTKALSLRYFNPIGADPQLRSGPYDPNPSHLLGNLIEVASGRKDTLEINGTSWATRDGSAIRDYVHVWDLARAHSLAVECIDELLEREKSSYSVLNLGSENGVTVKEFVSAFEAVFGAEVSKRLADPRPGDTIGAFAESSKAKRLLGWSPEKSIEEGIRDALSWNARRKETLGY
jgi:UDP-glucose 4-epimerase